MTRRGILWLGEAALVVALMVLGFGIRRAFYLNEVRAYGPDLPFSRESALAYRRVRLAVELGRLPARDSFVEHPDGIENRKTYEISREWMFPRLLAFTPRGLPLPERIRWLEVAWFCLGIAGMYGWIRIRTGSRWGGAVAAGLWTVGFSAVVRSTGLELSGDTFALPLVLLHLGFESAALRARTRGGRIALAGVSAGFLAGAVCSWDMVQMVVLLRAAVFLWEDTIRGRGTPEGRWVWGLPSVAVLLAAGLNPYLRHHQALAAPAYLLTLASLLGLLIPGPASGRPRAYRLAVVGGVLILGMGLGTLHREHYSHFRELLVAVVRFGGRKPLDPSLLTYEQRILWTPPLTPPSPGLTRAFFPSIVFFIPALVLVGIRRTSASVRLATWGWVGSILAYGLFFKFHLFAALFGAALAGAASAQGLELRRWRGLVATALLVLTLIWESLNTLTRLGGTISVNVPYPEVRELVGWFGPELPVRPVLANFPISGPLLAYAGTPIILHPKFEERAIRDRVRAFGEALFKGTETEFRDWADAHGAHYYVHGLGSFADHGDVTLQTRYFVDAVQAGPDTAARILEAAARNRTSTRWFRFRQGNRAFAVFSILSRADQERAEQWMLTARASLGQGEWRMAELAAERALELDPLTPGAMEMLATVDRIRSHRPEVPDGPEP